MARNPVDQILADWIWQVEGHGERKVSSKRRMDTPAAGGNAPLEPREACS